MWQFRVRPRLLRSLVEKIPEEHKEYIILNDEARELARHYIGEGAISEAVEKKGSGLNI